MAEAVGVSKGNGRDKVQVQVSSLDGRLKHPFERSARIGDVHEHAYGKLVKQPEQYPRERTWLELDGQRLDDSTLLGALVAAPHPGPEPELTLKLVWETGGGC